MWVSLTFRSRSCALRQFSAAGWSSYTSFFCPKVPRRLSIRSPFVRNPFVFRQFSSSSCYWYFDFFCSMTTCNFWTNLRACSSSKSNKLSCRGEHLIPLSCRGQLLCRGVLLIPCRRCQNNPQLRHGDVDEAYRLPISACRCFASCCLLVVRATGVALGPENFPGWRKYRTSYCGSPRR